MAKPVTETSEKGGEGQTRQNFEEGQVAGAGVVGQSEEGDPAMDDVGVVGEVKDGQDEDKMDQEIADSKRNRFGQARFNRGFQGTHSFMNALRPQGGGQ